MSERGANFYREWISRLPKTLKPEAFSVADAVAAMFVEAKATGIAQHEIEDEVGSAYQAVHDAVVGYRSDEP